MKYPLKNIIYEKIKLYKNTLDTDLLNELKKEDQNITLRDINKALLKLEILGLIRVYWVKKDAKRIELNIS